MVWGKPVLWAQLLARAAVAPVPRQIHGQGFGLGILLCLERKGNQLPGRILHFTAWLMGSAHAPGRPTAANFTKARKLVFTLRLLNVAAKLEGLRRCFPERH